MCDFCNSNIEVRINYKFPKTKKNIETYGVLINSKENLEYICTDCMISNPLTIWSEEEFCKAIGIIKNENN